MSLTFFELRLIWVSTADLRNEPKNQTLSLLIGPPNEPSNCPMSDCTGVPPVDVHSRFGHVECAASGVPARSNTVLCPVLLLVQSSGW